MDHQGEGEKTKKGVKKKKCPLTRTRQVRKGAVYGLGEAQRSKNHKRLSTSAKDLRSSRNEQKIKTRK